MTQAGDKLISAMIQAEKGLDKEYKKQLEKIFALLDPFDLDNTYGPFEAAYLELLEGTSGKFLRVQQGFIQAYVQVEFGLTIADVPASAAISRPKASASLSAVTKASIKTHSANGDSILKAYKDAQTKAYGVGRRHARESARNYMGKASMRTKGIKGYKRVTTGSETCGFCEMLESRGAVYSYESVGFRSHENCDCLGVPTVSGPAPSPDQKYVATPKSKPGFDKEKAAAAVKEWERKRDAGEIEIVKPPPRIYV